MLLNCSNVFWWCMTWERADVNMFAFCWLPLMLDGNSRNFNYTFRHIRSTRNQQKQAGITFWFWQIDKLRYTKNQMIKLNYCCLVNHSQLFGPICAMVCNGFVSSRTFFSRFFFQTNLFGVSLHLSLAYDGICSSRSFLLEHIGIARRTTDLHFQFHSFRKRGKLSKKKQNFFSNSLSVKTL